MKNSITYENIKNDLVTNLLETFKIYSSQLDPLVDTVLEKTKEIRTYDEEEFFDENKTLRQLLSLDDSNNSEDILYTRLQTIKTYFNYLNNLENDINQFKNNKSKLVGYAKDLRGLNSICKDDYDSQNDGAEIFSGIMNEEYFRNDINEYIQELKDYLSSLDEYLSSREFAVLNGIVNKEKGDYKIELQKLLNLEELLIKDLFFWLREEANFTKYVMDQNKSENYLKYYLLFK